MTHRPSSRLAGLLTCAGLALSTLVVAPAAHADETSTTTSTVVESSETAAHFGLSQSLWAALDDATRTGLTELTAIVPDRRLAPPAPDTIESHVREAVVAAIERAINPGDYECTATPLDAYVDQLVQEFLDEGKGLNLLILAFTNALNYPTYDALFHGSPGDDDYSLLPTHTDPLNLAFKKADRFWDVDTSDVQFYGMQGAMFADVDRVEAMAVYFGDAAPDRAPTFAQFISALVTDSPRGFDNPLWTLNAYAFSAEGDTDPDVQGLPDKLVFGDGILYALDAMGLGDAGPQAVMGHEFAHHVQYELGHEFLGSPESTRHTELEADALATYFVTNKRGLARNERRVTDSLVAFYSVGDCGFDDAGHHGTPNQRRKAAAWGAALARESAVSGTVLPAATVVEKFETALPNLVLPDAS